MALFLIKGIIAIRYLCVNIDTLLKFRREWEAFYYLLTCRIVRYS